MEDLNLYVNLTQKKKYKKACKKRAVLTYKEVGFIQAFIIGTPLWIVAALFAIWIYR